MQNLKFFSSFRFFTSLPIMWLCLQSSLTPAFEFHSSIQQNSAVKTLKDKTSKYDWLNLETKLQIEFKHTLENNQNNLFGKIDFHSDFVKANSDSEIRELYFNYYTKHADIRLGRQIITWGTSDLIFVTDIFPKNWISLIIGRPMEYLKIGTDALRTNFYFGDYTLETTVIPSFASDIFPTGEPLAYFNPFPSAQDVVIVKPSKRFVNSELGVALSRTVGAYDYTLNFYSGRDRRPAFHYNHVVSNIVFQRFPRMLMFGGNFKGTSGSSILRGEVAYYHTEDSDGDDIEIQNPSLKYLAGIDKSLRENRNISLQFGQEIIFKYKLYRSTLYEGSPVFKKLQNFVSLRFTDMWKYQTIKPKLFILYNFSEKDYYINGEYERNINDNLNSYAGFNLFGGKKLYTNFAQFQKNRNIYLNFKYSF